MVERRLRELVPGQRFLHDDESPWLSLASRRSVPGRFEDRLDGVGGERTIGEPFDRPTIPNELKEARYAHRRAPVSDARPDLSARMVLPMHLPKQ